jgi:predicted ATP-dependent endonuclease of OLD family
MKLISFRIKNFRSIVDSGYCSLAHDNITALIGQNESGKTSVLEALRSFSDGSIVSDILRSDLSLPEISCKFSLSVEELNFISRSINLPVDLRKYIMEKQEIMLTRFWNADLYSKLEIDGDEILAIYNQHSFVREKEDSLLLQQVDELILEYTRLEADIIEIIGELNKAKKSLARLEQNAKSLSTSISNVKQNEKNDELKLQLDRTNLNLDQEKSRIDLLTHILTEKSGRLEELRNRVFYARLVKESNIKYIQAIQTKELIEDEVQNLFARLKNPLSGWVRKNLSKRHKQADTRIAEGRRNARLAKEEFLFNAKLASRIFSGMEAERARSETLQELSGFVEYPSIADIAKEFEPYVPDFELFEDFSSLLPNRIDLDDLLDENTTSEGYKAARNFLAIAGLDAQFFKQQDSRILKQKIENLNSDLTLDFQDYWRQSVGKDNKIRIHFELEHYDISNLEKKGKPYIEFWIKDERERLYPKQRSRGVRWFLSFYLELKASAKNNKKEKILLIDEPGLSLHARAQEDVLKVFEDIKTQLSIIYTTHSPHLIDIHKLYRILAIQRTNEDDEKSQTIILNADKLMHASADTLSPIYTLMGARITDQQYIHKNNNIIVEDASSFFLIKAFFSLLEIKKEAWFLPAASASNVELLANLLLGWKLDFIIILNGNQIGKTIYSSLKKNICGNNDEAAAKKIFILEEGMCMIDLLSTIDFKNYVLKKRVGITETNSEFIELNDISPALLAMDFNNQVQEHKIKIQDFDQESISRIKKFIEQTISLLN